MNLRHLEERLNMIQEECNRLSEESDDELSATIDDQSEKNYLDDAEAMLDRRNNNEESEEDAGSDNEELGSLQANSVFGKIDLFLDNVNLNQKGSGRSRSEGWTFSDCESESPRHQEKILDQQGFARNKPFLVSGSIVSSVVPYLYPHDYIPFDVSINFVIDLSGLICWKMLDLKVELCVL